MRHPPPTVRAALADDLPGIRAIYNEIIATTTAVYSEEPVSLEDRSRWWQSRRDQGYPVLVAEIDGVIVGFASFGEFRAWPCYRFTVEHSVHVHVDHRGTGVGTLLLQALFPLASALGKHVMIAGIDAANHGSISLHARLGFKQVAHFHEVGYKFGRWLDLVFMQRRLDAPD